MFVFILFKINLNPETCCALLLKLPVSVLRVLQCKVLLGPHKKLFAARNVKLFRSIDIDISVKKTTAEEKIVFIKRHGCVKRGWV